MEIMKTGPFTNLRIERGEGCWLWDSEGHRYLDLLAGTWSCVLGHSHPEFSARVAAQLKRLVHVRPGLIAGEIRQACERLAAILPGELNHMTFLNTGSEAVELAIKIARVATGRLEVVGTRQGFYGATNQALAISEAGRSQVYLPQGGTTPPLPAPTCTSCPLGETFPDCDFGCLKAWREENRDALGHGIAAIIAEPVMAGIVLVPPPGYSKKLSELAATYGALLIADEVTTGLGRTGRWLASTRDSCVPDILVLGKALGNGLPVAAVVTTGEVARSLGGRLWHVQSHQNDPLSGAAACAVVEIIQKEDLIEQVKSTGLYLLGALQRLQMEHPGVGEVRGTGLMAALELSAGSAADRGARIQAHLQRRGVIVDYRESDATFRFFPPYVLTPGLVDHAMEAMDEGLRATAS